MVLTLKIGKGDGGGLSAGPFPWLQSKIDVSLPKVRHMESM